jgi:hypothetical protein
MFTIPNPVIQTDEHSNAYGNLSYETWSKNINICIITEIIKNVILLMVIIVLYYYNKNPDSAIKNHHIQWTISAGIFISFIFSLLFAYYYSKYIKLFVYICGFAIITFLYPLLIVDSHNTKNMLCFIFMFVFSNIYILLNVLLNKQKIYHNEKIIDSSSIIMMKIFYGIIILISLLVLKFLHEWEIVTKIFGFISIFLLLVSLMIMIITQYYLNVLVDLFCLFVIFIYTNNNKSNLTYLAMITILYGLEIFYHYLETKNNQISNDLQEPNSANEYIPEFIQNIYSNTLNILNQANNSNKLEKDTQQKNITTNNNN